MVITNKGATVHQVTIRVNGTPVSGTLPIQFIAGSDPSAVNTFAKPNAVSVQASTSTNPVTVPAYSVVRVDLNSPAVATVAHSASYAAGPVAPQEIVSLFGPGIGSQNAATSVEVADSAGDSQIATIFSVSSGQANILIPAGLAAGPATVTVLHGSAPAITASITITNSAPGLYSSNSDGAGVAAANAYTISTSNQRTNQTEFTCAPPALRSCLPAPLSLGAATDTLYIELYGTGIRNAASVQCFAGGISVPVLYAGPVSSFAGLDQVNISIPRSLAGAGNIRVYLIADGVFSNVVGLSIQ